MTANTLTDPYDAAAEAAGRDFAPAWRPAPGEALVGALLRLDQAWTEYGRQPVVTLKTREGTEVSVWLLHFRSRLEARWGCFFDTLGWRWEYEPLDFDGWIPDFLLLTRPLPTLVEVKPHVAVHDLRQHVPKIESALEVDARYEVLLLGCTPLPVGQTNTYGAHAAGLLGAEAYDENERLVRGYETAEWITCSECGEVIFFDCFMAWLCRLCGVSGKVYRGPDPTERVRSAWAHACNTTQWRAA